MRFRSHTKFDGAPLRGFRELHSLHPHDRAPKILPFIYIGDEAERRFFISFRMAWAGVMMLGSAFHEILHLFGMTTVAASF
jgi:hypothetical protein